MKTSPLTTSDILAQEIDPAFALRAGYILGSVEKHKPKKVLDAGCGRGFYVTMLSRYPFIKEIHGVDVSDYYLKRAQNALGEDKRVKLTKGSIYKLPHKDRYFDCIILSEVLEHLDDEPKVLAELKRVLKPGGRLLISVPHENFPFLWDPLNWVLMHFFNTHVNKDIWWLAGMWADHERLYTPERLKATVVKAGYKVKAEKSILHWSWPFSHFVLYAIGKNIVERLHAKEFDRFNVTEKKPVSLFLAQIMAWPSKMLDKRLPLKASQDLFVEVER